MNVWRNWHIYYSDPNRLLVDCLQGLIGDHAGLEKLFWLRHYAGGTHVRLRAYGGAAAIEQFGLRLVPAVEAFLLDVPSDVDPGYSPERARGLVDIEEG
jgi:hypothetical protein